MSTIGALDGILLCAGLWLAIGAAGLAFPRRLSLMRGLLFPLGAITGLALAASDADGQTPGIFLLAPDAGAQPGMRVK